ncbi:hypothetical protein AgCh_005257 [Apium graveolens]
MSWHVKSSAKDGELNHPADGLAWKDFNKSHPEFASESRNVRLGLSTDGFNPFGHSAVPYSCWPVIVTPYNLPHWMCMKQPYMFLSLMIPGPTSHGKNLDVYLRPLIDELKDGAHMGSWLVRIAWSIPSLSLYKKVENLVGLIVIVGSCRKITHFEETEKSSGKTNIFWELPYWSTNLIRHNLDVMHVEKNVFDNVFNTVMNVTGNTKDNDKARLDLKDICKRPTLELQESSNGKTVKPHARYTLSKKQVEDVCTWIKSLKLPDGYASNILRCVTDKTPHGKLKGMKSHDCHVFLERLLPIAFQHGML